MAFTLSPPELRAGDSTQQLRSYLYQLTEQLNYCLGHLEAENLTQDARQTLAAEAGAELAPALDRRYEQVKSIIIKTADSVQAAYDRLTAELSGTYVAKSEFGEYREDANARIEATAKGITQQYDLKMEVLGEYQQQLGAYIRTGYLYDEEDQDGNVTPVYGLAIGQNITTRDEHGNEMADKRNRSATLIGGELAFWQGDKKVASFNMQQLNVLSRLQVGGWQVSDNSGLMFKYIGGEG